MLPTGAFASEVDFMEKVTMLSTDSIMALGRGVDEPKIAVAVACLLSARQKP